MGRRNAAVFPEPVSARPMRSRPVSATGIALRWIGVGAVYPSVPQASTRLSERPRSSKLLGSSAIASSPGATVAASVVSGSGWMVSDADAMMDIGIVSGN